ncbi:MAG: protocatechuate dioxygenase [Solirubrobacterales bacterium]|nr:protocatechuate dioxygenase [Solirubrobacterales bacterium]
MSGHRVSRRQALAGIGSVSIATLLAACGDDKSGTTSATSTATTADVTTTEGTTTTVEPSGASSGKAAALLDDTSACSLTPEQTEGPYYFDADKIRSDVREGRPGTELQVAIRVRGSDCRPLKDAVVEIWHADAGGVYSGFEQASGGGPGGGRTDDTTYMRGAQVTDSGGIVNFTTVYPGWYRGRTVHIHAKVHLAKTSLLTTQLYFDEAVTKKVFARAPYSSRSGRDTFNTTDGIFSGQTLLTLGYDGNAVLGAISFDVAKA